MWVLSSDLCSDDFIFNIHFRSHAHNARIWTRESAQGTKQVYGFYVLWSSTNQNVVAITVFLGERKERKLEYCYFINPLLDFQYYMFNYRIFGKNSKYGRVTLSRLKPSITLPPLLAQLFSWMLVLRRKYNVNKSKYRLSHSTISSSVASNLFTKQVFKNEQLCLV